MTVQYVAVAPDAADQRLDRWLRRIYPDLTQGRVERLCRKGEIRVDGHRVTPAKRLATGQMVRLPPIAATPERSAPPGARPPDPEDAEMIRRAILYRDDHLLALDKPPGLAVQGGTGQVRHIDALADALRFDADERPRLVHRLDRDTSGVLVLARTGRAAAGLARAFQARDVRKIYWAAVAGVPSPRRGAVRLGLVKSAGHGRGGEDERMEIVARDAISATEGAKRAATDYVLIEAAGRRTAWVALAPITGRTHQLRAHMAAIGCPIIGDGKYGSRLALEGRSHDLGGALSRKLHLHARALTIPHPVTGAMLRLTAPLPPHMARTWAFFGWQAGDAPDDPFAEPS